MEAPEVQQDEELRATGTKEFSWAKEQLERTVKRAFQHACYLAQPDPEGDRYLDQISFDDERASGLDGTIVWKAMAERDKAFDAGEFGAEALVHNLRDADYGRTLSELCAAFYQAPRLPLLFSGDGDLRQAVYDAVLAGTLEIVDGKGETVAVTAPNEVNLASAGLRLAKPRARPPGTDQAASGRHDAGSEEGGGPSPPANLLGGRMTRRRPRSATSRWPSTETCLPVPPTPTATPGSSGPSTRPLMSGKSAICKAPCR